MCGDSIVCATNWTQFDIRKAVMCLEFEDAYFCLSTFQYHISEASSIHDKRTEVFSKLCDFFPDAMVPPRQNLMDLVQL